MVEDLWGNPLSVGDIVAYIDYDGPDCAFLTDGKIWRIRTSGSIDINKQNGDKVVISRGEDIIKKTLPHINSPNLIGNNNTQTVNYR